MTDTTTGLGTRATNGTAAEGTAAEGTAATDRSGKERTGILAGSITAAGRVLPRGPVPVTLATGALAVGGVIDWPVAAALGLGYLALRRWR